MRGSLLALALILLLPMTAEAGPPYVTDDPEPTDLGHFEVYLFGAGTRDVSGKAGAAGLDISYGAAPDLQLSVTVPVAYESPLGGPTIGGLGNVELAAKYRVLHQEESGVDVAIFPRVFLPSGSPRVGDQHASFFLPIWIGRDLGRWGTFGGGGCAINRGGDSQDFCMLGWAVTYKVRDNLEIGAEIYHQTPDAKGSRATTGVGAGVRYDVSDTFHLVGAIGPGIQKSSQALQAIRCGNRQHAERGTHYGDKYPKQP